MLSLFRSLPRRSGYLVLSALLITAQVPSGQLPEPAVPADPLELVTGDAQPVASAEARAAVIKSLLNAYALSNIRAYPYDRKTTFTTFGTTPSDGAWQLQDTSLGDGLYRWTAQGPAYSAINLYQDQMLYSNQPSATMPVRLSQVRTAIFFMRPMTGPYAKLRTIATSLNGTALNCILLSGSGSILGGLLGSNHLCYGNCRSDLPQLPEPRLGA